MGGGDDREVYVVGGDVSTRRYAWWHVEVVLAALDIHVVYLIVIAVLKMEK